MKICVILNVASHYRKAIYKEIDQFFDAQFVTGRMKGDIKQLDMSDYKKPVEYTRDVCINNMVVWQGGILKHIWKKYDAYIISDEIRAINHWIFLVICRLLGKKTYAWTHAWYGKETPVVKIVKKIFYKQFTGLFLYGNYARDLMIKEGFRPERLFVIHNSLDTDRQLEIRKSLTPTAIYRNHFQNTYPTLIFIGRLTKVKKLDMIVEAIELLNKKGKYCNLVFVGDGTEKAGLEALVKEKKFQSQVWFYGACYDESINAELVYNADVCVSPGNVGLTAMHTLSYGTPVITHDDFKYQMPEFESIKPGETGDFYKCGNLDSLVETIHTWLDNHKDRELVRQSCFNEIDTQWNIHYQMDVIKSVIVNNL